MQGDGGKKEEEARLAPLGQPCGLHAPWGAYGVELGGTSRSVPVVRQCRGLPALARPNERAGGGPQDASEEGPGPWSRRWSCFCRRQESGLEHQAGEPPLGQQVGRIDVVEGAVGDRRRGPRQLGVAVGADGDLLPPPGEHGRGRLVAVAAGPVC